METQKEIKGTDWGQVQIGTWVALRKVQLVFGYRQVGFWTAQTGFATLADTKLVSWLGKECS